MSEATITLDNSDEAVRLFGNRDQHLKLIRTTLGLRLVARGDTVQAFGTDEQVEQVQRVFGQLRGMLTKQGKLSNEDVRTVLEVVLTGGDRVTPQGEEGLFSRFVRPRTDGQARYVKAMRESDLTLCVGPAGTGKCVAADTLVLTGEGLLPIHEIAGDTPEDQYTERTTLVQGLHGPTIASHVYHGGVSPTIRIRTQHGLELEGTREHPILVINEQGDVNWFPLEQIQPGMFVAVARDTNLFGTTTEVAFQYQRNERDHCSRLVSLDRLDSEFAYFMGLILGDGCLRSAGRVIFTSADQSLRTIFEKTIQRWDLHWFPNTDRPYDMVVASQQLYALLMHLGFTPSLAHEKQVPQSIRQAPREIVVAFLQGLFDTDGTVSTRHGNPSLATSSPRLAREVQLLLLNLGVVTSIRTKQTACRPCNLLEVYGGQVQRFMQTVGFRLARKAALVQIRPSNPNLDVVPHVSTLLDTLIRLQTFSRGLHKVFYDYRIGRRQPGYAKLATFFSHFVVAHPARERLRWLLDKKYLWTKVVQTTSGEARVFDLTVPDGHSFVAGGIVNHNTYLATGMAVSMLRTGDVKKLVLVRPAVEAGERLGFLPGDLVAKINPYLRPLLDSLHDMMEPEQVKRYMENDIIEICPLAYMRGRTLSRAVIILDEGQNTTVPQMKMFLTRMGEGSKIIVTGDITQVDLPKQTRSGMTDAVHRLRDIERIAIVYLDENDIVRHPLVQRIVRAYEDDRPRKKKE